MTFHTLLRWLARSFTSTGSEDGEFGTDIQADNEIPFRPPPEPSPSQNHQDARPHFLNTGKTMLHVNSAPPTQPLHDLQNSGHRHLHATGNARIHAPTTDQSTRSYSIYRGLMQPTYRNELGPFSAPAYATPNYFRSPVPAYVPHSLSIPVGDVPRSQLPPGLDLTYQHVDVQNLSQLQAAAWSQYTTQDLIVDPSGAIAKEIKKIVTETISALPHRLFDTRSGELRSHTDLKAAFEKSDDFTALVLVTTALPPQQHRATIEGVVRHYFGYAMLSHRWDEQEPLYEQIHSSVFEIDGLPGITKLQGFLRTAHRMGSKWAWSDTCCIDKKNNVELQEALALMFSWYRNSAATIVYLSDVPDSSTATFVNSEYFKRVWTLQEVLAPRVIRLYKADWTPYMDGEHLNDKTNGPMLDLLEMATGIDKESLRDFEPGTNNVRERLGWARSRESTKEEDFGYSLMGIFKVRLTIEYGEKEEAFGRLLFKIAGLSGDVGLFDWVETEQSSQRSRVSSCLAAHPSCYYGIDRSTSHLYNHGYEPRRSSSLPPLRHCPSPSHQYVAKARLRNTSTTRELSVPCLTYKVESLKFNYQLAWSQDLCHCHISAKGLQPLQISPAEPDHWLSRNASEPCEYLLARPCHPETRVISARRKYRGLGRSQSTYRQLEEPFVVMLLVRNRNGSYRRISTTTPILALMSVTGSGIESSGISCLEIS
ncbi:hypothetical protein BV22DRAFT_674588 [Leucogyrophana mollusca]|uniref:Uncharacterized protein n=1 Tax=Leucogyrophana mollusca TaxID=85980 RepID=A0ACB8BAM0_9AGAM|nr:hypothetical protein BV22DRAFT_674588 [Leucogyrophana mollusca]